MASRVLHHPIEMKMASPTEMIIVLYSPILASKILIEMESVIYAIHSFQQTEVGCALSAIVAHNKNSPLAEMMEAYALSFKQVVSVPIPVEAHLIVQIAPNVWL